MENISLDYHLYGSLHMLAMCVIQQIVAVMFDVHVLWNPVTKLTEEVLFNSLHAGFA